MNGIQEVGGSIPPGSTKLIKGLGGTKAQLTDSPRLLGAGFWARRNLCSSPIQERVRLMALQNPNKGSWQARRAEMRSGLKVIALLATGFALSASATAARAATFAAPAPAMASPAADGGVVLPVQYFPPAPPFVAPPPPGPLPPGYYQGPDYGGGGEGWRRRQWGDDEDEGGDYWRRRRARQRWCYYHPGRC